MLLKIITYVCSVQSGARKINRYKSFFIESNAFIFIWVTRRDILHHKDFSKKRLLTIFSYEYIVIGY